MPRIHASASTQRRERLSSRLVVFGMLCLSGYGVLSGAVMAQSVNLIAYPEELEKWTPVAGATVTPNVATAPTGATTADQINDVKVSGTPYVATSGGTAEGGLQYVFSVHLKAGTLTRGTLMIRAGTTVVASKEWPITATWQRLSVATTKAPAKGVALTCEVYPGTKRGEAGNVLAWGAQFEKGSTPTPYPVPPPSAPVALAGTWDGTAIQLTWNANPEPNVTGYHVERGTPSTEFALLASTSQPAYTDGAVVAGTTYLYRVRALNPAGASAPSAEVSVTIPPPPSTPTGLTAQWTGSYVELVWNANSETDLTGYRVERRLDSATFFGQIAAPAEPAFNDVNVVPGRIYHYRVRATNAAGIASDPSEPVTVAVPGVPPSEVIGPSRGYLTTPQELADIAAKAATGIEPYRSAVDALLAHVGAPDYWPYGNVDPTKRDIMRVAAALVYAKGIAYHLTGNSEYAASARQQILALTGHGTGKTEYSGSNGDILTLGRHIPGYIFGADLIEGSPGWTAQDKQRFQQWLSTEVYHKIDWASDARSTNWGSMCSAATAVLADYLAGSGLHLRDRDGMELTPRQAYEEANLRQLDRMNSNPYMYNSVCAETWGLGFRPDGGIPEELGRGSTGCWGPYLLEADSSWSYMHTHLSGTVLHAELMLRRGDASLFNNLKVDGGGSILRAIHFVIQNPNNPAASFDWLESRKTILEIAHRYYRDPAMARQLGIGTATRHVAADGNSSNPHFGTLTHGFAVDENPGPPPVSPPPGE